MKTYVLTPGQSDILRGTYSPEFINKNVIAVSIEAPEPMSPERIRKAMLATALRHPGLRSVLTATEFQLMSRQWVHAEVDALSCALLTHEELSAEYAAEEMSLLVEQMADRLDIAHGITWGVIHLRTSPCEQLVFVFNHIVCDFLAASQFIRTFIRSYARDGALLGPRDTYLDYLSALEDAWSKPPADDALWWHDRPWASVPTLPESEAERLSSRPVPRVDVLHEGDLVIGKLTEDTLIRTIDQVLRDLTCMTVTRVDAAVHGRSTRLEQLAGGWLSHALPYIHDVSGESTGLPETKRHAKSWPAAFGSVRTRPDLAMEHHLRAHAFVNFFGSADPLQWIVEGFRMSTVQPAYQAPDRSSLTPIHLKVRKSNEKWAFVWTLASGEIPAALADQVIHTLTERAS